MRRATLVLLGIEVCLLAIGCGPAKQQTVADTADHHGLRIYVTNEVSGDLSVIDPATRSVIATVPLGKRPRGIHPSPDVEPFTSL